VPRVKLKSPFCLFAQQQAERTILITLRKQADDPKDRRGHQVFLRASFGRKEIVRRLVHQTVGFSVGEGIKHSICPRKLIGDSSVTRPAIDFIEPFPYFRGCVARSAPSRPTGGTATVTTEA
jgi:hypothetical protein